MSVSLTMSIIFVLVVTSVVVAAPLILKDGFIENDFDLYSENAILTFSTKNDMLNIQSNETKLIYKSFQDNIFLFRYLFDNF